MTGDAPDGRRPRRLRGWRQAGESRIEFAERIGEAYGLVLFLILVTFVVMMTLPPEGWAGRVAAVAAAGLTAVLALTSSDIPAGRVRLGALLALGALALAGLGAALESGAMTGAAFAIDAVLLLAAAATIMRRVLSAGEVEFRTILGAICVFTLLGLLFGFLYVAFGRWQGGDFFTGVSNARSGDYLFFSYTTLTTTGYGNLVPSGQLGQAVAVIEMLVGQIFLVTLVAGLVSLWRPVGRSERREHGS